MKMFADRVLWMVHLFLLTIYFQVVKRGFVYDTLERKHEYGALVNVGTHTRERGTWTGGHVSKPTL